MFDGRGEIIVQVSGVSKLYARKPSVSRARLSQTLWRVATLRRPDPATLSTGEFWAVQNVSFDVRRGEAVGIIGLNGSGKTTLLRMLAGQILPDRGEINVVGSPASMIDLTAGFSTGASGRANVFLRGAALGRSRKEMEAKFDEIVDFAELGSAIDAPISTYSSGMLMRLAFSIMVASQPDILFVDEILAVGDFRFRQKCLTKIREIREQCSIVMVSHSMMDIRRFCDRVIVMNQGHPIFIGAPDEGIRIYQESAEQTTSDARKSAVPPTIALEVSRPECLTDIQVNWQNADEDGDLRIEYGEGIQLDFEATVATQIVKPVIGVPIYNDDGTLLTAFSTDGSDVLSGLAKGDRLKLRFATPNIMLNPGKYTVFAAMVDGTEFLYRQRLPSLIVRPSSRLHWGTYTTDYSIERLPDS
jgi:ABC-type polysaccharide/polyol phosphate transport system ATPase subunit